MKWNQGLQLAQLAPLAAAFALPDQAVFASLAVDPRRQGQPWLDRAHEATTHNVWDGLRTGLDKLEDSAEDIARQLRDAVPSSLDDILGPDDDDHVRPSLAEEEFDTTAWLDHSMDDPLHLSTDAYHGGGHGFGRHEHNGRKKANQTVYELITQSKYTTTLAKLINEFPDLVDCLNNTEARHTVFAPTDKAFAKIPAHAPKPSKEQLKAILSYHVADGFYPAGRVLVSHTIPTLLRGDMLADDPVPQRLSVRLGLRGLHINFNRVVAINIFGTNGVIHAVDSVIVPPPRSAKILTLLPSEFSTLSLALTKTELLNEILDNPVKGGTLFAPSNAAFRRLGTRINGFLFSKYGTKYLKALLKYHIVPHTSLYSDAVYGYDRKSPDLFDSLGSLDDADSSRSRFDIPRGHYQFSLPTMLDGRDVHVDIARFGRLIEMEVNAFSRIVVQDGIAKDGVIQVPSNVLIPPKTKFPDPHRMKPARLDADLEADGLSLEDLIERLEPYV